MTHYLGRHELDATVLRRQSFEPQQSQCEIPEVAATGLPGNTRTRCDQVPGPNATKSQIDQKSCDQTLLTFRGFSNQRGLVEHLLAFHGLVGMTRLLSQEPAHRECVEGSKGKGSVGLRRIVDKRADDAVKRLHSCQQAALVIIPSGRLGEDFFRPKTGVAGEIVQKFVTYGVRLVILGDLSRYLDDSSSFRDFVRESNEGSALWFVTNRKELRQRWVNHS
jgi:hypothetical protein